MIDSGDGTIRRVGVDHYENFPVASWLCPARLRPTIRAIYRFARTADDIADEGVATPAQRLADLAAFRADLARVARGAPPSRRWPQVFEALAQAINAHRLPIALFADLLSAFEQDVTQRRYADRTQLLDYCRRSANPVGRLLLHLYGISDAVSERQSDALCSALQLANFWQDLSIDVRRDRLYVPQADCEQCGVTFDCLLGRRDEPQARRLIAELVSWSRRLMREGEPLALRVPGRAGWELRFVVQGGLRILDKIADSGFATIHHRPVLGAPDIPVLAWRAATMRAAAVEHAR